MIGMSSMREEIEEEALSKEKDRLYRDNLYLSARLKEAQKIIEEFTHYKGELREWCDEMYSTLVEVIGEK